jgi:iron complex outermembrane receptor protein
MITYYHNRKFTFTIVFLITCCIQAYAQKAVKILGTIVTNDNKPVSYVTISLVEIKRTAVSQEDGSFTLINLKPGNYTLKVSHVGTHAEQRPITVAAGQTSIIKFMLTESASQLNEVVVNTRRTINRRPVNIGKMKVAPMDLPQSIVTIGQDVMEEQQAVRLSDVVKNANGVYLYSTRGGTQETFAARGYNFSSTNMFKNGFRVNSGVMPEVTSLEKVEILKGSAALLYGNVAPGGVLNLVTKKPKFEQGGSVSMTAGSYSYFRPIFDIYGPLSQNVAYRLNGTYENAKSYRDVVKSERFYINPSFLFKLSDKTNILLEGDYLHHDFTPDFGTGAVNNNVFTGVPRSQYYQPAWSSATTKQATATASINHSFNSAWQLSGGVSYQNYNRGYKTTERIQPSGVAATYGDFPRTLNQSKTLENYVTGQLNLNGQFTTGFLKHQALVGADFDHYNNTNYTYTGNVALTDANGQPLRNAAGQQITLSSQYLNQNNQLQSTNYDNSNIFNVNKYPLRTDEPIINPLSKALTPTNRFGAYFNDLISISEKFKVLAGVRWSYQYVSPVRTTTYLTGASSATVVRYNPTGVASEALTGKEDKAFSPRVGIVYKPLNTTSLFASYSNSFVVNTGTDLSGNSLKPSLIDQYEIGIKNEFFEGNLSVNATVFRINNNNLAQTAPFQADGITPNSNTNLKVLAGKTKSEGVEFDIAGHPVQGLDIIAGYAYNYARFINSQVVAGNVVTGDPLLNVPEQTANATVFYTFSSSALKGFRIGASAFYLGKRYAGFNNVYPATGQPKAAERLVSVKGFTTVDLSLGYTYHKFSILGKLSNIGNVLNYNVHENYSVNPIAPRQIIGTATYRF